MRNRFLTVLAVSLPVQLALVAWAAAHPDWVERWYSQGAYPYISGFFRWLYGWIPFSVGDLMYIGLILWALVALYRNRRKWRQPLWTYLRNIAGALAVLHATFYLLWGMNYYREPLALQMNLDEQFTLEELQSLTEDLAAGANRLQLQLAGDSIQPVAVPYSRREVVEGTLEGYENMGEAFPHLVYSRPSLKPSLISGPLSYMGYGGYLNPFTGEAQANARLPLFRYPVVCAHEVGHQIGYSAENETNFIGYLVCLHHPDPYFRYSAITSALGYCLATLGAADADRAEAIRVQLNAGVLANYQESRDFWDRYANPLEPVFKALFNTYLEANRQKDGIRSYNRVVSLMVAFHREVPVSQF